jgi:hypothetical protein
VVDTNKNLVNREFEQNTTVVGTKLKVIPVKTYYSIGKVERYYIVIRCAFEIIAREILGLDKNIIL